MNEIVIVVRGQNATGPAFSEATGGANKLGGALKAVFAGAAVLGAAKLGESVVKMAGDFEASTTRLVTSAGESQKNLDGVRKGILDMAGQVGDSADALSAAMYTIESGGQHGADGLTVLKAAAQGAKAEGADLTTVADALTSELQDYHLKASDSARITSEMVAAVGAGKTTFEQFAGSLHSVLPIASSAGISFEDISAAIASMTVHGESADQATQNLADTIRHMVAPTQVQTKELAQLGISSGDLAGMLGTKGLTGTLQTLSEAIIAKMGPSGKVLLDAFNKSKDAANDANIMISKMPKTAQDLAKQFQSGSISLADFTKSTKALPPEQANLLKQFAALQNTASGFSDVLKAGGPAAQTYQAALAKATGDATGLNVALMLTGENTAYVNQTIKTISGATVEAGGNVKGWSDVQQTFNQKMSQAKDAIGAAGIRIGNMLLPVLKDAATLTAEAADMAGRHETAARNLGIVVAGLATFMVAYKVATIAATVADNAATVAKGIATTAQWAWNTAAGIGNSTMYVWLGVQAIDFAAWVRRTAATGANTVATLANAAASEAARIATEAWIGVQLLLDAAMDANPIGLIIIAIAALIAIIVVIATKTRWFQELWHAAWDLMKQTAGGFKDAFRDIVNFILDIFQKILDAQVWAFGWIPGIGPKLKQAQKDFQDFRDSVNSSLGGITKNVNVTIQGHLYTDVSPQTLAHGLYTGGISTAASGGARGLTWMNERGPELVKLPNGSMVYSHEDSMRMTGQSSADGRAIEASFRVDAAADSLLATLLQKAINNGLITISARYVTP
jgi:TP901 family phage tail tape measure protein